MDTKELANVELISLTPKEYMKLKEAAALLGVHIVFQKYDSVEHCILRYSLEYKEGVDNELLDELLNKIESSRSNRLKELEKENSDLHLWYKKELAIKKYYELNWLERIFSSPKRILNNLK